MRLIAARLRKINKPFVKSIKSPDGDIIDCVPLNLQHAFDLPELEGTMPLGPRPPELPVRVLVLLARPDCIVGSVYHCLSLPNGNDNAGMESEIKQIWSSKGESCPNGTIPIRRTTASDILRSISISKSGRIFSTSKDVTTSGHEHATGKRSKQLQLSVMVVVVLVVPAGALMVFEGGRWNSGDRVFVEVRGGVVVL
ncbi:uncharacterized protein [Rutidosis leptorrhynchoides]|uniref:uncharacterized protein n=1 Tax=Rutidosis leptorrhynchoides TaxID=125765 RepID=UPI003A98E035